MLGQPLRPGPGRLAAELGPRGPGLQRGQGVLLTQPGRPTECGEHARRGYPGLVCHPSRLQETGPSPSGDRRAGKSSRQPVCEPFGPGPVLIYRSNWGFDVFHKSCRDVSVKLKT